MGLITKLAKLVGVRTTYIVSHVSPSGNGWLHGDMTVTVAPWITHDNWKEVREFVGKENGYKKEQFSIVACCKV